MTDIAEHFMAESSQTLSERLGAYLTKKVSGPGREKRLAQMIDCDPRSARNMFDCYWPSARHWRALVRQFGADIVDAVFGPEIDHVVSEIEIDIRALENQLEDRKAALRRSARRQTAVAEVQE